MLNATVDRLAEEWPAAVTADESLDRALAFLGIGVEASRLLAASYVVATGILCGIPVVAVVLPPTMQPLGVVLFLALATTVVLAARNGPPFLARVKRTRALGAAPTLVTYACVRMRLQPVPERAAAFAGDSVDGPLGDSLDSHVERSAGGPGTGFGTFADEWDEWFPSIQRGCSLLESAGVAPADRRSSLLDRARAAVLDGTRKRMATFGASVSGPATGIYAFGVFLPLALASLLPALRAAGVPTPVYLIVVVYDVLLPLVLLVAAAWLLSRRPMAFPPPDVDRTHPNVPDSPRVAVASGLVVGVATWIVAEQILLPWTPPIAAIGAGVGTALVVAYRPMVRVRREVEAVEAGLGDGMAMIGRRVASGMAVERAAATVAAESSGPFTAVLADAADRQRRLGLDLERALAGPDGALADFPSDRLRGSATMLAMAAREGTPAGDVIVALSEHLERLDDVERETRRSVESVTNTLSNTAAIFGPLVGGVTVALAGAMGGPGPFAGAGDVSGLGLAVGVYVLLLAVILTVLTTGLTRGLDRSLAGYRSGIALLGATATYLAAVVAGTLVV